MHTKPLLRCGLCMHTAVMGKLTKRLKTFKILTINQISLLKQSRVKIEVHRHLE